MLESIVLGTCKLELSAPDWGVSDTTLDKGRRQLSSLATGTTNSDMCDRRRVRSDVPEIFDCPVGTSDTGEGIFVSSCTGVASFGNCFVWKRIPVSSSSNSGFSDELTWMSELRR
jgi:hypothetical protein